MFESLGLVAVTRIYQRFIQLKKGENLLLSWTRCAAINNDNINIIHTLRLVRSGVVQNDLEI